MAYQRISGMGTESGQDYWFDPDTSSMVFSDPHPTNQNRPAGTLGEIQDAGGVYNHFGPNGNDWSIVNGKLYNYSGAAVPAEVTQTYPSATPQEISDIMDPNGPGNGEGGSDFANILTGLAFIAGGAALTGGFAGPGSSLGASSAGGGIGGGALGTGLKAGSTAGGIGGGALGTGLTAGSTAAGIGGGALGTGLTAGGAALGGASGLAFGTGAAQVFSAVQAAGGTAAQGAAAAEAVSKGFGLTEALKLAGVAAPVIGALISGGAIKDATGAQQQATDQAIAQINSGATGATQGINDAQLAGVGLQNDALKAGLDQLQSQYDTGVAQQNESLGATLADLTRRYDSGVTEQRGALDRGMADLAPYREAGAGATNRLTDLLGTSGRTDAPNYGDLTKKFTLADFWDDPVTQASYKQGLDIGTKALENSARSNGSLNSGATLKALTRFGTDYTGNQAAASQGRFVGDQNNTYNRLMGVSNVGQNAVNSGNTLGFNTAANIANQGNAAANAAGGFRAGTANNIANAGNLFATNSAQMRTGTANNIANSGNVAATNAANINIGANNSIANLLSGMGNARGAASIAQGNNIAGAGNTIANWFSSQDTLDKVLAQSQKNAELSRRAY